MLIPAGFIFLVSTCLAKEINLLELALHPITLGYGKPAWVRGRPMLAHGVLAEKILNDLVERSKPFGTDIDIREGVGYVRVR